jgi:hypothetical protein
MIDEEMFEYWLQNYRYLYVYCKTDEITGLPTYLIDRPIINLQIGLNMPVAIPDLKVGKAKWQGTLRFNGKSYFVSCLLSSIVQVIGETDEGEEIKEYPFVGSWLPSDKHTQQGSVTSSLNVIVVDFKNRCKVNA